MNEIATTANTEKIDTKNSLDTILPDANPTIKSENLWKICGADDLPPHIENMKPENSLISYAPTFLQPYIENISNVKADGNCGFRCVAILLGKKEDQWPEIRKELMEEMERNKILYQNLYGVKDYERNLQVVNWKSGPCSVDKWMIMPDFGHLIANKYKRPLHFFSSLDSSTFLPLSSAPSGNSSWSILLSNTHFYPLKLKLHALLPPIAIEWEGCAQPIALYWKETYSKMNAVTYSKMNVVEADLTIDLTKMKFNMKI